MFSLNSCTSQTTSNIEGDIPFHARPPVLVAKILIHLVSTWMNRISWFVGFIHDNLSQIGPLRDPNSVQIIENPI
ncbi:hypothetical protein Hanom_Chr05g00413221 [Helianthus anomalus]